jgi:hypothetical protein
MGIGEKGVQSRDALISRLYKVQSSKRLPNIEDKEDKREYLLSTFDLRPRNGLRQRMSDFLIHPFCYTNPIVFLSIFPCSGASRMDVPIFFIGYSSSLQGRLNLNCIIILLFSNIQF